MNIYIEKDGRNIKMDASDFSTLSAVFTELGLSSEDVIAVVNGKVSFPETALKDDDDISLLAVISGG